VTILITICGGGNAAHVLAGLLGDREGFSVQIYTPYGDEAKRWQDGIQRNGGITVNTPTGKVVGHPRAVCRDPGPAVAGSRVVLLALPAFAHETILRQIAPHLSPSAWIGALPARGGFDLCARDVLKEGASDRSIFGFQTLPWACRIQRYGQSVGILGTKDQVDLTVWPPKLAPIIAAMMQEALGITLNPIGNFLSLTLADTGQLIHPGVMYGLFREWNGQPYKEPCLFYQGVDAATAEMLQQMSNEVQAIRVALEKRYSRLDLSAVRPLGEWLQRSYHAVIADSSTLQSSFVSNRAYEGLLAPMQKVDGGFIPDFKARYLSEDVPFGLLVTRGIAELAGIATPIVNQVLSWAQNRLEKDYLTTNGLQGADVCSTRAPQRYGFDSLDRFVLGMGYL